MKLEKKIFIVMYHYVREIKNSKYPKLKGLEFKKFKDQINFFIKDFNILSNEDFIHIIKKKKIPKKNSILLTFDDGYKDHYEYVYPYLKKKKISANFYPPVKAIENKEVLDVNKIHFILEKEENKYKIIKFILNYLKDIKKEKILHNIKKININDRFDDKKTTLIKILLQKFLPFNIRKEILSRLFETVINIKEEDFSKELYMNSLNLKEMYNDNMTIGSHGDYHLRWGDLNFVDQEKEIDNSIKFFKKLDIYSENFSVCYPYGSYNNNTIKILKKRNIMYALTTKYNCISKSNIKNFYKFPRFDTNDL